MNEKEFICDCNIIHQDIVELVQSKMPKKETFYDLADFFKILGDPTRTKILFALDKSEMCVCDIANLIGMTKSSVSHQLAILRAKKIVKCRKVATTVYYSLDDEHMIKVFELGLEHVQHQKKELEK